MLADSQMLIRPLLVFGAFGTTNAVEVELVGQGSKIILDAGEASELHLTTDLLAGIVDGELAYPAWTYLGSKMEEGISTAAQKNYELKSVTREGMGAVNFPTYEFNVGTYKSFNRPMRIVLATFTLEGPFIQKALAQLNHYVMYFMLVWMPATGIAMGIMGGKGIPFFDLFTVPGVAKARGDIAKPAYNYHK